MGGRSRVAAQMLAGKGFVTVYNLSGGFKAWDQKAAFGPVDQGLTLFSGSESPREILTVAYGLESGLRDFYQSQARTVNSSQARDLFQQLAGIEELHQRSIFEQYLRLTKAALEQPEFEQQVAIQGLEGGLSTEEYLHRFQTDPESLQDMVSLAMSIEAQALDLYTRVAETLPGQQGRGTLLEIAAEEQRHLQRLGELMETTAGAED
ncbi:MAG: sulfurtransferase [Desulfohalobiaceae bacterium]|nr:sulfurtransferase [Desulfohalobiaceae bacterium]